jgi:hypothetical protein
MVKLNGWQRLWVVLVALWVPPVVFLTIADWPTTTTISRRDVSDRMKPEDRRRLSDNYDVMTARRGGPNVVLPRIGQLQHDKDFMAAPIEEQKAYLTANDPEFAKASVMEQNAYLGLVTGMTGPVADIDGHIVKFIRGIPEEDTNQTARAYDAALRRILARRRAVFFGRMLAFWALPAIVLYALGWAIGWVRRGFGAPLT